MILSSSKMRVPSAMARRCCFLSASGSMRPLWVWARIGQPLPVAFDRRISSTALTRGGMETRRRAFPILPKWISCSRRNRRGPARGAKLGTKEDSLNRTPGVGRRSHETDNPHPDGNIVGARRVCGSAIDDYGSQTRLTPQISHPDTFRPLRTVANCCRASGESCRYRMRLLSRRKTRPRAAAPTSPKVAGSGTLASTLTESTPTVKLDWLSTSAKRSW
jgi:hypothetical protein